GGGTHVLQGDLPIVGAGEARLTAGEVQLNGTLLLQGVSLRHSGGSLNGTGAGGTVGTANGAVHEWSGGWLLGTITLTNDTTAVFSGSGEKRFGDYAVLHNYGTITWTGGLLRARCYNGPATLANHAGARFVCEGGTGLTREFGNRSATFTVDAGAAFAKTDAGSVNADWVFNQNGTFSQEAGALWLRQGGSSSGSFTNRNSALLGFGGGTHTLVEGVSMVGPGSARLTAGTLATQGAQSLDGATLRVEGGTLGAEGTVLAMANGALWEWAGGALQGTMTLPEGAVARWIGPGEKLLWDSTTLHNHGSIAWTEGPLKARCYSAAVTIRNHVAGVFELAAAAPLSRLFANRDASLVNEGRLALGTPGAEVTSDWLLTQQATGALELTLADTVVGAGFGRFEGSRTVALSGTLRVNLVNNYRPHPGATYPFLAASSVTGAFAEMDLAPLMAGQEWVLEQTAKSVALRVGGEGVCIPLVAGAVGWWPAEGTALDAVGGQHGALRGDAAFAAGRVGLAFALDGAGDFVEVPGQSALNVGTNDFTVLLWLNFGAFGAEQVLAEKYIQTSSTDGVGWSLSLIGDSQLVLTLGGGAAVETLLAGVGPLATDTWYLVGARRQGNRFTLFLDGRPVLSQAGASSHNLSSAATLKFGHRGHPTDTPGSVDTRQMFLAGRVDEVLLFNRAVSDAELAALHAAGEGGYCKAADLALALSAVPEPAMVGSNLTFTATIANHGPGPASNVRWTAPVPAATTLGSVTPSQGAWTNQNDTLVCNLGTLTNGAVATVEWVVVPGRDEPVTQPASVLAGELDSNLTNNTATVVVRVKLPDQEVLFVNVHGSSYNADALSFFTTLEWAGARATYVNLDANGKAAAILAGQAFDQVWVFDLSSGTDNYPADWQAIADWYQARLSRAVICDGRSISSYWRGRHETEGRRLTENYYENLKRAGGGLMLGTDHNDFQTGINAINDRIGLERFSGNFSLTRIPVDTNSPLMTFPNDLGPDLFNDSSPGQTPFGLQPNGLILYTVAWHGGNTNTPGISATIRGGIGFRVLIASPAGGSAFIEEAPVRFQAQPKGGAAPFSYAWSSDRDGALGTGPALEVASLSPGTHLITVLATDGAGAADAATVGVTVQFLDPAVALDLQAGSDSGRSSTDNLTAHTTLRFDATINKRGTLEFTSSGSAVPDEVRPDLAAGAYEFSTATLEAGVHRVTARFIPLRGDPVTASLPVTIDTQGPRVTALDPPEAAVWLRTVDRLDVSFDSAIDAGSFILADVAFTGPLGPIVPTSIQLLESHRFRIHVPAQRANGVYALSLGPEVADWAGNLMDQNADGANGVPDQDVFTAQFSLSLPDLWLAELRVPNQVVAGQPIQIEWATTNLGTAPAVAPWRNRLFLSSTAGGSSVRLLASMATTNTLPPGSGLRQTGVAIIPVGLAGSYYVNLIADEAGQVMEANEDNNWVGTPQPIEIRAPDLVVDSVSVPAGNLQLGQAVSVTWIVRNAGTAEAAAAWHDRLYLSREGTSGASAAELLSVPFVSPLAPGASYTNVQTVTLPLTASLAPGDYLLVARADRSNTQPESDEENNEAQTPVNAALPPLPDLALSEVRAAQVAPFGLPTTLVWEVTNQGRLRILETAWTEKVSLSNVLGIVVPLAEFRVTNSLAAGTALARTQEVMLAHSLMAGEVRFLVTVDSRNEVFEENEANNTQAATDLTELPAELRLYLARAEVNEGGAPFNGTVARNGSWAQALEVTLTNSHPSELSVPDRVVIPAGAASASFGLAPLRDGLIDGDRLVRIGALAPDYAEALAEVWVRDIDRPLLTLQFDAPTVAEGSSVSARVTRDHALEQELTVVLNSAYPAQLLPPAAVVIPAQERSRTFTVLAVDDALLEGTVTNWMTASATGFASATAGVAIVDDDLPTVVLSLADAQVSEGAGPLATRATVTRSPISVHPLVLDLVSTNPAKVRLPATIVIPENQATATFPVAAVDNSIVDGDTAVFLRVFIRASGSRAALGEGTGAVLTVLDDDGPTLRLEIARDVVGEGLNPATTATVSRNTPTADPLTVQLASSDLSEVIVPPTVTIPMGADRATFSIETVADGVSDGNQSVVLTASAAGFTPGLDSVVVSDGDLPDLVLADLSVPPQGSTGADGVVSYRIENRGLGAAGAGILTRCFLSLDALVGNDYFLGDYLYNRELPVGAAFDQSLSFRLPGVVGQYWIIVVTDQGNRVRELLEDNNTAISAIPIQVNSTYTATVQTDLDTGAISTTVTLTGTATWREDGRPAANVPVNIHIWLRGTRRVLPALSDDTGQFTVEFVPLPNEAGDYQVGAAHPGEPTAPVQDTFRLVGLKLSPPGVAVRVLEGTSVTGVVQVVNLSEVPLSGLTASVVDAPANLEVSLTLGETSVPASGQAPLTYRVAAKDLSQVLGEVRLQLTSSAGAGADGSLYVRLEPLRARLAVAPGRLEAAMTLGGQQRVEFEVSNQGGAASGLVTVAVPSQSWLRVATANPLPSIAPGESRKVTLLLTPGFEVVLGPYRGALVVSEPGSNVTVPFEFLAVSDNRGDLLVRVEDEFTYYAAGAPGVTNAQVTLRNAYTGAVVTNGPTDARGRFFVAQLLEAHYDLEVSAPQHSAFRGTTLVRGGQTNEIPAFLSRETVQYRWTVVPTTIEDRTRITIQTTFETFVPVPVVTVDPTLVDLSEIQGGVGQVTLQINNHGLVAAEDLEFEVEEHPDWEVTALSTELGRLPAQGSISLPLVLRRVEGAAVTKHGAAPANESPQLAAAKKQPHGFWALIKWKLLCPGKTNTYSAPVVFIDPQQLPPGTVGRDDGGPGEGVGTQYQPEPATPMAPQWPAIWPPALPPTTEARPFVAPVRYEPLIVCDCKRAGFEPVCYGVSTKGTLLEAIADVLAFALSEVPYIKDIQFVPSASVKVCTCCDELGMGLTLDAGGSFELRGKLEVPVAGLPPIAGKAGTPAGEIAYSAEIGCKLELPVKFNFSVDLKTDCHLTNIQFCARLGGSLDPTLTCALGAKATLTEPSGQKYTVQADARAQFKFGKLGGSIEYCYGKGLSGEFCVGPMAVWVGFTGKFPASAGTPGTRTLKWDLADWELIPRVCVKYPTGSDNAGLAAALESLERQALVTLGGVPRARSPSLHGAAPAAAGDGVCAKIRLQIDQDLVLTRNAFKATLELDNRSQTSGLEAIQVLVTVTDANGEPANHIFGIRDPVVVGLGAVDGSGRLPANQSGSASWILVPTRDAAPTGPTAYGVGGLVLYQQDGVEVTIPLYQAPITVYPDPALFVKYFHQRDVFSDDPFTPEREPSLPFNLAVMVENRGQGEAQNVRIISGQPRIVDNERGLLIDFKIIGTVVAGRPQSPSLTANFGFLGPNQRAIGRWLFTSTLQGLFTDYSATFEHLDSLGKANLSLVDEVSIHEMIQLVQAQGPFEDGQPDFLVNDLPDLEDLPDTLYLSDGSTHPVQTVKAWTLDQPPGPGHLTVQLTTPMPAGWAYLRALEPSDGQYTLHRVRRADGVELYLKTNVWTTDRTFIGTGLPPVRQHLLHLLDHDSPGTYTLDYVAPPPADTTAPSSVIAALPAASYEQVNTRWSGEDDPGGSGLAFFDIYVSVDQGPFVPWLQGTTLHSAIYPGELGRTYAFYSVAVDRSGNREAAPTQPDAQTAVSLTNSPPVIPVTTHRLLDEGETLVLDLAALDPDPGQTLVYRLGQGAPGGASIQSATGRLLWPTGEAHGPSTNHFEVIVTDNGQPPLSATGWVTVVVNEVNQAPLLAPIANVTVHERQTLTVPCSATDRDLPTQRLTFTLAAGAPLGAAIDSSSGVFRWVPAEFQGPSTNRIAVIVTDDGVPPLSATGSFTVIVRDTRADFRLSLGATNLLAGQTASVPIVLDARLDLTNLTCQIDAPVAWLENLALESVAPEVTAAGLQPAGAGRWQLNFGLDPARAVPGTRNLGRLAFGARADAISAVVGLPLSELVGVRAGGFVVTNGAMGAGRVIVVADLPVLWLQRGTSLELGLYGRPGRTYLIEASAAAGAEAVWSRLGTVALADRVATVPLANPGTGHQFYRAIELGGGAPWLSVRAVTGPVLELTLEGEVGVRYQVQTAPALGGLAEWQPAFSFTLTNAAQAFTYTNRGEASVFLRAQRD
ncbi:MAG: DUF11 domain-containing protein, partial [Verrucomicrobia bacterium]|nr:DUF11 domain-containing protein [Verrucomicrobiota bacterium]